MVVLSHRLRNYYMYNLITVKWKEDTLLDNSTRMNRNSTEVTIKVSEKDFDDQMDLMYDQEKQIKRAKIIQVIHTLVIIALMILIFILRCKCPPGTIHTGEGGNVGVAGFSALMNTNVEFEDGLSRGSFNIKNVESNVYPVTVQIVRNDTEEAIYQSEEILPGYMIEDAQLLQSLPAGTYDCTAYFSVLNKSGGTVISKIGTSVTITVKH